MWRVIATILLFASCVLAEPARIVSTSPSITEILFALGAGPRVVGVSTYCRHPAEVGSLPKVGSYSKPNVERIAMLRPDLVIVHQMQGDVLNRLSALGIRTVTVEQGSLANLFASVRTIGAAVGRKDEAEDLVGRIASSIRDTTSSRRHGSRPSVLLIVAKNPDQLTGLVAAGRGTYLSELLDAAGGRNALTQSTAALYPRISLETVIHLNPDYILDASGMGDQPNNTPEQRRATVAPWLLRSELTAVRNRRVFAILSEALVVPGPRVLEGLQLLAQALADWEGIR